MNRDQLQLIIDALPKDFRHPGLSVSENMVEAFKWYDAQLSRLRSQVALLREALRPFAECAEINEPWFKNSDVLTVDIGATSIDLEANVGDLRRAAQVMKETE